MEYYREVEKNLIKKNRKTLWSKFIKAIKDYHLINENDKIMVCISGGKDSFILAKLMQELNRHGQIPFEVGFVVMDPGYKEANINKIIENAKLLNIPIDIFKTDIFEVSNKLSPESPCYMCARMRRGYLYDYAKNHGYNKIALGHHFDDVIETILMSVLYGGEFKTMLPKLKSTNFEGIELIRPLYYIRERDIISFTNQNNLEFINCACKFTANNSDSKRKEVKELIKKLEDDNLFVPFNIFKSAEKVNLETLLSYKKDGKIIDIYDDYEN
ncbi:MAG: tRNA 2-thiocytidine biosynthesis protein TtcA [Bacilli bacterium]|nr:tRNA 2-thiocytidine biosynthesis protein TtcA [Bacilli bacterium]